MFLKIHKLLVLFTLFQFVVFMYDDVSGARIVQMEIFTKISQFELDKLTSSVFSLIRFNLFPWNFVLEFCFSYCDSEMSKFSFWKHRNIYFYTQTSQIGLINGSSLCHCSSLSSKHVNFRKFFYQFFLYTLSIFV